MPERPTGAAPDPFIADVIAVLRSQKRIAERAVEQLTDDQLHVALTEHTSCVAVIMKHLAGNMKSRWTDFLTSDGEKPWRHRDGEFIDEAQSREQLMETWEAGWACALQALGSPDDGDLDKQVTVRGRPQAARGAILGQLSHYGYHVGQIVLVAQVVAKDRWQTLSIPRGESEEYNKRVWGR